MDYLVNYPKNPRPRHKHLSSFSQRSPMHIIFSASCTVEAEHAEELYFTYLYNVTAESREARKCHSEGRILRVR